MSRKMIARSLVDLVGVAPDVVVTLGGGGVAPGLLKPRVLVGGVVDHEVGDDPDAAGVGRLGQASKSATVPIVGWIWRKSAMS